MNEVLRLLIAIFVGMLLGTVFFGGLWWTVYKGLSSPRPALWFLVSTLLRFSIVLGGFYLISDGDWKRLLCCLLGFVIARGLVKWRTSKPLVVPHPQVGKVKHAS